LREGFTNLIENAVKFMGDQPEPCIRIETRGESEGYPVICIRDNGIGIDPAHHEQVFSLFSKLDPVTPGTGIGLSLVRRIIDVHGGRIWLESEGTGKGSTFCFTFPKRPVPGSPESGEDLKY
jgi:signal transduction histidine kinase